MTFLTSRLEERKWYEKFEELRRKMRVGSSDLSFWILCTKRTWFVESLAVTATKPRKYQFRTKLFVLPCCEPTIDLPKSEEHSEMEYVIYIFQIV